MTSSPDQQPDSKARNAALALVDAALTSGRIIQADRDMRVDQIRLSRTMQEIDMATRDLRATPPTSPPTSPPTYLPVVPTPTGSAPPPPPPASPGGTAYPSTSAGLGAGAGQPWPLVNYGPASGASTPDIAAVATRSGRAIGGIIAVVVLVSIVVPVIGAVIAFASSRNSFPDFSSVGPTDDTTYLPGQAPGDNGVNVHTLEGYQEMVEALRDKAGTVFVYDAVIYPRYAVLEVPTGTNQRYQSWYWDGKDLEKQDIKGSSTDEQLDLSLVEPQLMIDLLTLVRGRIDEPTSWYVVIADRAGADTQISAYASNDFSENTYILESLDGTVVYDSEAQP